MKAYDAVISLGGFCGAAAQLRARGLRPCAMPFDWLFMSDESSIRWLIRAFSTTFDDFCLKKNLVPVDPVGVGGIAPYLYKDTRSGYVFIHHFHKSIEQGGYEEVYTMFCRRLERLVRTFAPGKSILLILSTPFGFAPELAEELLRTIRARFPQTRVDLHVIQFAVKFENPLVLADRIPERYSFVGERYARARGDYDNSRATSEWSFLDEIQLVGRPFARLRGWQKFKYKIWRSCRVTCAIGGLDVWEFVFVHRTADEGVGDG